MKKITNYIIIIFLVTVVTINIINIKDGYFEASDGKNLFYDYNVSNKPKFLKLKIYLCKNKKWEEIEKVFYFSKKKGDFRIYLLDEEGILISFNDEYEFEKFKIDTDTTNYSQYSNKLEISLNEETVLFAKLSGNFDNIDNIDLTNEHTLKSLNCDEGILINMVLLGEDKE